MFSFSRGVLYSGIRGRWRNRMEGSLKEVYPEWSKFREIINAMFERIVDDPQYLSALKSDYVDIFNWKNYLNTYRRGLIKSPSSILSTQECLDLQDMMEKLDLANVLELSEPLSSKEGMEVKESLFRRAYSSALHELKIVIDMNKILAHNSDLTMPHEWYPYARLMKRKIIYHGGPTNSGKTYHAIQRLKAADPKFGGGLYCGPLRLLALEVYDTLNRAGISTDLLTGQEKKLIPGSTHISSTVEMVNIHRQYDVVVVDEIQMIADRERSHAWTRALLGLRAREIHLCGGLEAAELVSSLCESTRDDFELVKYDRLSTLQVEEESLRGDYSKVRAGDCIVAFSIVEIFTIRKQIEQLTNLKCAVIYGQLPPETRSTQARLFNDENSGYDVLVASDAIGMGLNLNIGRIIFHTVLKNGAYGSQYIEPTHIKQIAGRAGRKSSKYSIGKVTTWQEADLAYVRAVMQWDIPPIKAAGIFPTVEQVDKFIKQLIQQQKVSADKKTGDDIQLTTSSIVKPELSKAISDPAHDVQLAAVVQRFIGLSKVDPRYFMCNYESFATVANWLHTVPLSTEDRFTFSAAPVNFNNSMTMTNLYEYAALYACGRPVPLNIRLLKVLPKDLNSFRMLCDRHNTLELYLWLSSRFPMNFIERENCITMKSFAIGQIEASLPSHSFHDKASLEAKYQNIRRKLKDVLPPITYGEMLRVKTEEYLSTIPKELKYIMVDRKENEETVSKTMVIGKNNAERRYSFAKRVDAKS